MDSTELSSLVSNSGLDNEMGGRRSGFVVFPLALFFICACGSGTAGILYGSDNAFPNRFE